MSADSTAARDRAREDEVKRQRLLAQDDQRRADVARADAQRQETWRADERRQVERRARELAAKQAPAHAAANAQLVRSVALVGVGLAVAAGVTKGVSALASRLQTQAATLAPKRGLFSVPVPRPVPGSA